MTRILTSVAVAALLVACSNKTAPATSAAAPATAQPAAANTNAPAPATVNAVTGKVVETLDGGSYTYLKLQTANGEVWAAVPKADLKVGSEATVYGQMTMQNWQSETLKRKFDSVIFATLTPPATAGDSSAMGGMMGGHGGGQGQPAMSNDPKDHMAAPDAGPISVEKAPGGKTVAEIWAGRTSLGDKPVVVRGKVVKSLSGIMGKNWIHLRDGSGKHEDGSDDITVTMAGNAPKVGDVVVVSGTVRVDKDFGAGYMYPVIIEDAKIQ